ncbi:hypothetical protein Tco_0690222 [Tanacetum coccineum]
MLPGESMMWTLLGEGSLNRFPKASLKRYSSNPLFEIGTTIASCILGGKPLSNSAIVDYSPSCLWEVQQDSEELVVVDVVVEDDELENECTCTK